MSKPPKMTIFFFRKFHLIWLAQSINTLVSSHCMMQLERLCQFPGDMQYQVISSPIHHLFSFLCHGYQWSSIEKSGELPICLLNSFWLLQKQFMANLYINLQHFSSSTRCCAQNIYVILKIRLTSLGDSNHVCFN